MDSESSVYSFILTQKIVGFLLKDWRGVEGTILLVMQEKES